LKKTKNNNNKKRKVKREKGEMARGLCSGQTCPTRCLIRILK
jgi:hypothetical protein